MTLHSDISHIELRKQIRLTNLNFGANIKLKIYGKLTCWSGKKLKKANRVFFSSQKDAEDKGCRPYGHCMAIDYKNWKHSKVKLCLAINIDRHPQCFSLLNLVVINQEL